MAWKGCSSRYVWGMGWAHELLSIIDDDEWADDEAVQRVNEYNNNFPKIFGRLEIFVYSYSGRQKIPR